ncbi:TOBE domain-containing protein [Salsipaludibacter albus]|uniref:TOBE domain-containing protein n=1 Tax=Salsipaludibacter albus TaxID=2849650 RepID=UPI001EE47382|nr:TOBE domain-containing protein [Salsipaludibacter albus]MBY5161262.1 TOBE domain-containing protein [Salsipaludibacter albus]
MDDHLRIGQAAGLLDVSVDTLRRWADDGELTVTRSSGNQRLVPLAEVRRLLTARRPEPPVVQATSARNQLPAVVTAVVEGTAAGTVEMQAGPHRLLALTTAESIRELDLAPGTEVIATIKATNVVVGLPE